MSVWPWLGILAAGLVLPGAARPLSDPDVWWHVRTGTWILHHGVPHHEPWAFTALGRPWVPTAWLSDATMGLIFRAGGWSAILGYQVLLAAVALAATGWLILRQADNRISGPILAASAITLAPFLTARPQALSLVFVVWLSRECLRVLDGRLPRARTVLPVTYLWANVHGMWILAPVLLTLAGLAATLDARDGAWRLARRCFALSVGAVALAALTPAGPKLAYWGLVVRHSASAISEWQPTTLSNRYMACFAAMIAAAVIALARRREPASRSQLAWLVIIVAFSMAAVRDVAPAVILLAPFTAGLLQQTYGERLRQRSSIVMPRAMAGLVLSVLAALTLAVFLREPAVPSDAPMAIVQNLESRPGTVHVLNTYNLGGFLTGMGAPKISVAIDGRTDNYDPAFIDRYLAATNSLIGWRQLVDELQPDVAVLPDDSALAVELQKDAGWRLTLHDHFYVLLEPPASRP